MAGVGVNATRRRWKPFLQRWLVTTVGVLIAAHLVGGIRYDTFPGLLVASLLLGVLNAVVRPLLLVLSLPLLVFSLGLFVLFINAGLLYVVGGLVTSFHVDSFGAAFWGGLIISLVGLAASVFLGIPERPRLFPTPPPRPPTRPDPPAGSGPVIDV